MRYYTKLSYANGKNIWIACSNKTNSYLTEKDIQSFDTWEEAENHIKELKKKMPLPKKQPNNKKARRLEKRREMRLNSDPIPSVKFERATYDTNFKDPEQQSKCLYGGSVLDLTGKSIPEITGMDVIAADRWQELLPPYDHLTPEDHDWYDPFHRAVASLFHKGGKLKDYGIIPKEGYDLHKIMSYMRAVLPDWGPKHEHKIGGVAHMLRKWCIYDKGQANERP